MRPSASPRDAMRACCWVKVGFGRIAIVGPLEQLTRIRRPLPQYLFEKWTAELTVAVNAKDAGPIPIDGPFVMRVVAAVE